jgi:hypothetical protein
VAGGPILPSSVYVGGSSGNLSMTFLTSTTGTTQANSTIEGIGVVGSLATTAAAVLQFNMPEVLPSGQLKLRLLAFANATTGIAYWQIQDGATSPGANIANASFTTETAQSINWATLGNVTQELKQNLTTSPTINQIVTVVITFGTTTFTLTATSVWQASLVWE